MLLDFQMPRMNGLQVVEKTRQFIETLNSTEKGVKVIEPTFVFLTAYANSSFIKHMKSRGLHHVYEKPLE